LETPTPPQAWTLSPRWGFAAVAAVAAAIMLVTCLNVWSPPDGLTRFLSVGREFEQRGTVIYRATPKYEGTARWGFDGQLYAEMALDPLLRDPRLKTALDNPPYRAHRMLLPWLAWAGGLGRPAWVLSAYAAMNPLFWLGYVALLYALFRGRGWAGVAGFAALVLTCGVIASTFRALTDFPAFVLMTWAAVLGGTGGALALALAALTREINLFGLAGVLEFEGPWGAAIRKNLWRGALAVGPLALWWLYVHERFPMHTSLAGKNFDWPLHAIYRKTVEVLAVIRQGGIDWPRFYKSTPLHALLTIVATLTQCLYLVTHREWRNRLWRVGIVFVPLFLCIGYQVWYSHLTVTRHALPITLAFNLLLAARPNRRWLLWFLLGNCFVPYGVYKFVAYGLETPQPAEFTVEAAAALEATADTTVDASYGAGWSGPEVAGREAWREAAGERAALVLANGGLLPLETELSLQARTAGPREVTVSVRGSVIWQGRLAPGPSPSSLRAQKFILPPGETVVEFSLPSSAAPSAFAVSGLRLGVAAVPAR
jgi:hypothetical protein